MMPKPDVIMDPNVLVRQEKVRQLRAVSGRRRAPARLPVMLYPLPVERQYRSALLQYVDLMLELVRKTIYPALPALETEANASKPRVDGYWNKGESKGLALDAWSDEVDALTATLSISIDKQNTQDFKALTVDIGQKTSTWNSKQWQKTIRSAFGVNTLQSEPWLSDQLKSFQAENMALIKSIKDQSLGQLQGDIQRGFKGGKRSEDIARQIEMLYGSTKSRAKLIARDQVSKLNGQLTELRQKDIGVTEYKWHTSQDERVRDSHKVKNGKVYKWSDPPADTGHPGNDYQCRCWAEAMLDKFYEEPAKPEPEPEPKPADRFIGKDLVGIKPQPTVFPSSELSKADMEAMASAMLKNERVQNAGVMAIGDYVEGVSNPINSYLRTGKLLKGPGWDASVEDLKHVIGEMDHAIEQSIGTKHEAVLYRLYPKDIKFPEAGGIFQDKGYSSTSRTMSGIIEVAKEYPEGTYRTVKIIAPAGTKGVPMVGRFGSDYYRVQDEFLLPRGTQFKVVSNNAKETVLSIIPKAAAEVFPPLPVSVSFKPKPAKADMTPGGIAQGSPMDRVMQEIRNENIEHIVLSDSQGVKVLDRFTENKRNRVSLTMNHCFNSYNQILTHNHPGSWPFSGADMQIAVMYAPKKMVVESFMYRYVLTPSPRLRKDAGVLGQKFKAFRMTKVDSDFLQNPVNRGKLPPKWDRNRIRKYQDLRMEMDARARATNKVSKFFDDLYDRNNGNMEEWHKAIKKHAPQYDLKYERFEWTSERAAPGVPKKAVLEKRDAVDTNETGTHHSGIYFDGGVLTLVEGWDV